ncbi:MAG TPA: 50S ribosomal protein L4 [Candidatus Nanoarchaeia archaeon]|nr:50S ribosomal protein L4 [Candidatus Nanoarchaeia archaeon]
MKILTLDAQEGGNIELPAQFEETVRPDLIKRAYLAEMSSERQPYGSFIEAGKRASAKLSRRRRNYRGAYGLGISRVPRKIMSRSGTRFSWVGAVAPHMRGGRPAHPPKAEKIIPQKINKRELSKAIRSAIAATVSKEVVETHATIPSEYPFIIDSKIENIKKTSEVKAFLIKIGLTEELQRSSRKNVRAGRGKMRGRKYKRAKGPLIVVSKNCPLTDAAKNIAGVDVADVKALTIRLLSPGAVPGRVTLWSSDALAIMDKERLYQ